MDAVLFDAFAAGFVSVRSAAGEGEEVGAWEASFVEGFTEAGDLEESCDESRPGEEALGFAARETSVSAG